MRAATLQGQIDPPNRHHILRNEMLAAALTAYVLLLHKNIHIATVPAGAAAQSSACASARDFPATSNASVAAMKASRSPSSTPCVSDVSCEVRRSFTI